MVRNDLKVVTELGTNVLKPSYVRQIKHERPANYRSNDV